MFPWLNGGGQQQSVEGKYNSEDKQQPPCCSKWEESAVSSAPQKEPRPNVQLMHWMSAVMAEHIHNNNGDLHYVWNNGGQQPPAEGPRPPAPLHPSPPLNPKSPPQSYDSSNSSSASTPPAGRKKIQQQSGRKYTCKMCPQVGVSYMSDMGGTAQARGF